MIELYLCPVHFVTVKASLKGQFTVNPNQSPLKSMGRFPISIVFVVGLEGKNKKVKDLFSFYYRDILYPTVFQIISFQMLRCSKAEWGKFKDVSSSNKSFNSEVYFTPSKGLFIFPLFSLFFPSALLCTVFQFLCLECSAYKTPVANWL